MKKSRCTFIIGLLFLPFLSFSQFNYLWAFTAGGAFSDDIYDTEVDKYGDLYVVGSHATTYDFDPGEGTSIPEGFSTSNVFFAKYTSNGDLDFVKSIGTDMYIEFGSGIAVDDNDNIYISGIIGDSADLDPGLEESIIETNGAVDAFVAKYDSLGDFEFAFTISTEYAGAFIEIGKDGNLTVYGSFSYLNDFDQSQNSYILDGGDAKQYLSKFDTDGNLIYAEAFDTLQSGLEYVEMTITGAKNDFLGNTFITGYFIGGFDFNPGIGVYPLISASQSLFLAKYDALGNFIFAKNLETTEESGFSQPAIVLDDDNSIYISGSYIGIVDFNPDEEISLATSSSGYDNFFAKFDSTGSFIYVKLIQGTGEFDFINNIELGENKSIYISGTLTGTNDLDPAVGEAIISVPNNSDIFLAKYDNEGNYITSISMGGGSQEVARGMALDLEGNVYLAGEFYENIDPDPYGEDIYTSNGYQDIFVAKYGQNLTPTTDLVHDKSNITVTPNPGTGLFRISFHGSEGINTIRIVDMNGNEVNAKQQFSDTVVVDLEHLPSGVYWGIVSNTSGVQTVKLVKI